MKNKNWIPKKLDTGRVTRYIMRKYGKKAFKDNGDLKISYINKAIQETNNKSLQDALRLAKTFKRM